MDPITGVITPNPVAPAAAPAGEDPIFSSEGFLKLLAAQIRGQNPLEPMSDTEFVAQMAQFSQLEQMTSLAENMKSLALSSGLSQGSALIGRQVDYRSPEGLTATGTVERVAVSPSGDVSLVVGGVSVPLADLIGVGA